MKIPFQVLIIKPDYKALYDITKAIKDIQDNSYKEQLIRIQKNLIKDIMNYWEDSETIETILNNVQLVCMKYQEIINLINENKTDTVTMLEMTDEALIKREITPEEYIEIQELLW